MILPQKDVVLKIIEQTAQKFKNGNAMQKKIEFYSNNYNTPDKDHVYVYKLPSFLQFT